MGFGKTFSNLHINVKNLTKWGFGHVSTFFKSFWPIYIDMKNPCKNENWVQKWLFLVKIAFVVEYSTGVEYSTSKLFFWKVWIMCYILHIYHIFWKRIFAELHASEVTRKNTVFQDFPSKIPTCGFTENTVDEISYR